MKKSANNLKNQSYYWVRRAPSTDDESGVSIHPNWEPMLWDADTAHFHCRGDRTAYAPEDLADIGEIIERRARRVTRKGWMPTYVNRQAGRADPVYDNIQLSRKEAAKLGSCIPLRVEISWSAEDHADVNKFCRSIIKQTSK